MKIQSTITLVTLCAATALSVVMASEPPLPPLGTEVNRPAVRIGAIPQLPRRASTVIALPNGDPFRPIDQQAPGKHRAGIVPAEWVFKGTMGSGPSRSAIIGDKRYRAGDAIGEGGVILEVLESRVDYRDEDGVIKTLLLKQTR